MSAIFFKFVLLFLAFSCNGAMLNYAQTNSNRRKSPDSFATCFNQSNLLTNRKGETIWLSSEKMTARATETAKPIFPKGCRCRGLITVFVLVDTEGKVACALTKSGNPLLRVASVQAAKKWQFEPYVKNGKAVAYAGVLSFDFDASGESSF